MNSPEFPLDKHNPHSTEISTRTEQRPAVYRYVDSLSADGTASPGYDSLQDYWYILLRYRKTLLGFILGGLAAAIAISLIQTPIYRVRTSLDIQGGASTELKGANESSDSYTTPESYVETQVKLLQSESLLEDVIDKLKLQDDRPASGLRALVYRAVHIFPLPGISRLPQREQLIRQMQRNLTVQISGNSHLLEVIYESPNPQRAADVANTLVSEFIELSQEERWKAAQGTADWLTKHLDEMKVQLEASEAQLQNYAGTSGLSLTPESESGSGSEKESLAESRLKELQDELSKAQSERIANDAKYEEAKNKPADSLPEIQEDQTMSEYRQKLAALEQQEAELSATLTPDHYKVRRVEAQINELKAEMQKERSNVVQRIRNEYAASLRREQLLSEAHSDQERTVADQSSKVIHYDTLKRDVDSNRRLYEMMLQRVKEASLIAAMRDSNVLVVDRARPPLLPYRPNLPMNSGIGLFGGLLLGLGFVVVRERVDRRITAPGDMQVYLDLPELGVIPLDGADDSAQPSARIHLNRATPSLPSRDPQSSLLGDCPELATWKRKPSLLAECTRTTLTSILLPSQNGDGPRVIVFTSPSPGEGKTTVACNLSIAVAEIGRKVLLIDGDLRRPRLHKVFGAPNYWGLSDILRANATLESIPTSRMVYVSEVSGLFLLPGGSCGVTPSNLFYSPRMSRLLERLRSEFDMILIDAPPMTHLADARVLGRLADGVILVVRAGQTTTESALFAAQRFAEDGTRVLGTVLNSWDPKGGRRYGYESYNDYQPYVAQNS
jgi:succinoglycan biosynthesis transport protein ExoP